MATPLSLLNDCVEKDCREKNLGRKETEKKKTRLVSRKYFSRVKASGSLYNTSELQSALRVTRSNDSLVGNVMTLNFRLIYRSVGKNSITNFLPKGSHDEKLANLSRVFRLKTKFPSSYFLSDSK